MGGMGAAMAEYAKGGNAPKRRFRVKFVCPLPSMVFPLFNKSAVLPLTRFAKTY
jgi:hypothetical protein